MLSSESNQYRLASPGQFKKAQLTPIASAGASVALEAEELGEITMFHLTQTMANGQYRLDLEGATKWSIDVWLENGSVMIP
jgi:hypothetical protein